VHGSRPRSGLEAITDPALHNRAADLFSRALDLSSDEQAAFLQEECRSDTELLRILTDLLERDREGVLLEGAESEAIVQPRPGRDELSGRTLSHYRILGPMAVGGMGMVYEATETRLERTVALKFLPPSLQDTPASRERFLREARAIACIDHQNVCPVYEIEEADGLTFIAMAYLKGVTLAKKLKGGPLSLELAIEIALQTARGLQAAHAKGIVHRDIKPGNLMLSDTQTPGAMVRILDFGIAQWSERSVLTENGLVVGTVAYMAPEQVEASRVDERADIWSLGVVLYEMLSGRVPFEGKSVREILAAIAGPTLVDFAVVRDAAPAPVVDILRKALAKKPTKRFQTVSDFITALEGLHSPAKHAPVLKKLGSQKWLWMAGALVGVSVLGFAFFSATRNRITDERDALKIAPFTYYPGYQEHPSISPDGKTIAFVGQGSTGSDPLELYVQLIGSTDPLRLTTISADSTDRSPVWNPSATKIAFLRTHAGERFARILIVPALGGAETDLGVESVLSTGRLAWSPDGRALAFSGARGANESAIFELSLPDHSVRQLSFPHAGQSDCCPQYDPAGNRLAFKRNEVEIVVVGRGREALQALPARASWPGLTWTADGRALVYSWFGKLVEVQLASGSIKQPPAATALGIDISDITIRGTRMAYVRWDFEHSIWQLSLQPARTRSKVPGHANVQLIASTMREDTPQFSPDGELIAFASQRSGSTDIWIARRDGAGLRRLTFLDGQNAGTPRWSPDGKWLAFDLRPPSSKPDIWVIRASGGEPRRVATNTGGADVPSWSQDGHWIYYHSRSDDNIWKRPWQGGDAVRVTGRGGFEGFESSDGKSIYYSKSDQLGIWRVDLANGGEDQLPELKDAGQFRHWAFAPNGIYYVPNSEALRDNATVRFFCFATRKTTRVGTVGKLVTAGPGALAVSRDETRLLYVHMGRDNRNIMLVENFK
jgi:serine/threonine protein kinase/WD40 repeat protein